MPASELLQCNIGRVSLGGEAIRSALSVGRAATAEERRFKIRKPSQRVKCEVKCEVGLASHHRRAHLCSLLLRFEFGLCVLLQRFELGMCPLLLRFEFGLCLLETNNQKTLIRH